jgi:hypothetical protein
MSRYWSASLLLLLITGTPALACWCGWSGNDAEALRHATQVFVGHRISSVTVFRRTDIVGWAPIQRYVFAVEEVLKGSHTKSVTLFTTGSNCDFLFDKPSRYLVFVEEDELGRHASICLNTRQLPATEADPSIPSWRYSIEPIYRPLWGSAAFLWFSFKNTLHLEVNPQAWQLRVAQALLGLSPLPILSLLILPVRRRVKPKRLLLCTSAAILLSLIFTRLFLNYSVWFTHLVR